MAYLMTHPICGYLSPKIQEYIDAREESGRWFSRQAKVDNSTIYRLLSNEQKSLSIQNAEKILRVMEPDQERCLAILSDFFPEEARIRIAEIKKHTEELSVYLSNDVRLYEVYLFAIGKKATIEEVKDQHGKRGHARLLFLLEVGIVSEVDGRIYDNLDFSFPSDEILKSFAAHNYQLIDLSTPGTSAWNLWGGVSEAGLTKWYDASQECRQKWKQILIDDPGDKVVAGSIISGPPGDKP